MAPGGCTVWLTGLPCSGKTTIARLAAEELRGRGLEVELLDGDEIRQHFSAGVGFSKEDRGNHLQRVAYLCHLLSRHGVVVFASFVSPYRENRDYARRIRQTGSDQPARGDFVEVYVNCPVEVCIQRDTKGMYKKALAGEIKQFTGVSDPYEEPVEPELELRTDRESIEACVSKLLECLERRGIAKKEAAWASDR